MKNVSFSDFYWDFTAIDTLVNDAIVQLMVFILPIELSIDGDFFCQNSMRH